MITPVLIDSDNAMGSAFGDPDDGFAIAALLKSGLPIVGLSSVGGNTSEDRADQNNRRIGELCGFAGPYLRAREVNQFVARDLAPLRVAALGPLTNIAAVIDKIENRRCDISQIIIVGGNASSAGRWPPIWPHEFNLTRDRRATRIVFDSEIPLLFLPLDVLATMRVNREMLHSLDGELGDYLRRNSARWFRRLLMVKGTRWFRVWDLVAAMFLIDPEGAQIDETRAHLHRNGYLDFAAGTRTITVMCAFDRERWWRKFVELINGAV